MSVSYRAFLATPRIRFAGARSIARFSRPYSSEAAAPAPPRTSESASPVVDNETPSPSSTAASSAAPVAPKAQPSTKAKPEPRSRTTAPSRSTYKPAAAQTTVSAAKASAAKAAEATKAESAQETASKASNGINPNRAVQPPPAKFDWNPTPPPSNRPLKQFESVDWEKSFHGLGTQPVTEAQFQILTQQIDLYDIQVKPDGILYLPEIKYRRRLNEAFGPMGWGIIPRGDTVVGKEIVTREYALIVNGCFVSQALGVNNYFSPEGIPQAVEGAKSNALMRCCKDLGIASELWDPNFIRWFNKNHIISEWAENTTTKKKRVFYFKKGETPEVTFPWKLTGKASK